MHFFSSDFAFYFNFDFLSVLYNKKPDLFNHHTISAMNKEKNEILEFFFTVSFQATSEAVRSVPELQKFLPKLENFEAFERQKKVFNRSSDEKFLVLNHGEFFVENFSS